MTDKKKGIFPLVVGALAGAAAVFFSEEKNRAKTKKTIAEAKINPEAFAKKTMKSAQKSAKNLAVKAKVAGKKALEQQKRKIAQSKKSAN